ncbi:hypothetical protein B0H63DRAFT_547783 [Podospora didyma]|uniref:RanBD1 domain-containing protein n=1 Tax=Podospora didyma TaxID=330526 RepID=A0AAE0NCY9_9PEZI|nr:hypothetical protein B0H63DRAFT_547783 [Podospora didyma]
MDTPGKRRGIFAGIPGFFRGSSTTPADQDGKKDNSDASAGALVALPPVKPTVPAPAPESPVKRASNTQMASRKILERPQGPSSKLSQSVTAADFTRLSSATPRRTNFSSAVAATPKRMPGDDPNQRPFASSTISHASTSAYRASSNIHNGSATTGRNVFLGRSSVMRRPEIPSFSPRVPANTVKQSFPPNTPGRPPRGSTADISGRGFSQSMSAELFNMRIPSPPRELTGEVLAKQVPNDTGRYGSVYADEFLERYCPPDLDEHQKRQFYCILDLRRLKYAADEVFAKKDWKINIANFAKEYEKSRSLIMLRYGLYEFKTVRPSGSVVKDWKEKHGIPDLEDEAESAVPSLKTNGGGSSKRKAEDELAQNDTALTASSSNGNKRARAPEASPVLPAKNKRKADAVGEPDENQPAKLSRPSATPQKTPSATKSVFESIANNTSTTPAKFLSSKNNFSSSTLGPKLTNGARSVFDGGVKAAPTTNIFSHLSDASKGSSGKDADSEGETSSNPDEDDSEVQEVSPSDEASAAASGGVSTPQFNAPASDKSLNGTQSTASSDGGGPSQGRSLFDRMTKGSDGQPVKLLPSGGKSPLFAAPSDKERSFGGASATPSINFGAGAASSTPATNMFAFGGGSSQPTGASIFSQQPPSANPIFGGGLAPGGGTSTGTNTPFTLGGASSLATTPATGTPEPAAELEPARGTNADGDEAPQEQISLTDGGPGEEDEVVVHEVRAKALKLVLASDSDDESTKGKEKSPWKVQGVGPLRVLKHKTSGTVRMLLRAEPRGNIALNRAVLPNVLYKVEPKGGKYVKLTTTKESGKGLETWMLQVKTADAAQALADALEANKSGNATEA